MKKEIYGFIFVVVTTLLSQSCYFSGDGGDQFDPYSTFPVYPGTMETVAGNGEGTWENAPFGGDNDPAVQAYLFDPCGLALDGVGNMYIADTKNERVRKVDTNGIITTVAGNGIYADTGDNGPAVKASFKNAHAICIDPSGNLYIVDSDADRIRKVDTTGKITTFAGTGTYGYSGNGGPANKAQLCYPYGICSDQFGNIYIADDGNDVVRKVNVSGTITTVAGNGKTGFSGDGGLAVQASLYSPTGVCVDSSQNLYLVDAGNNRIRKVDLTTGIITTIAGNGIGGLMRGGKFSGDGGPAVLASMGPVTVCVDDAGNIYFSDYDNACVRKIDTSGIITTVAGIGGTLWGYSPDGPACRARLRNAHSICVDTAGSIYIADSGNNRIRKVFY